MTAVLYIKSTGKNTFVSIFKNKLIIKNNLFINNKLLKIFSCGQLGFKGRKKETPFACSVLANKSALFLLNKKITNVHIIFKGISLYKKIIINTLFKTSYLNMKLNILTINDITHYPHNGCRSRKLKKR